MDLSRIKPDKKKAVFLAKKILVELVYDAVNLEGICYTLPEVQTLLDGVTIGGHKIQDQNITLNQANAWKLIFSIVLQNKFDLSETTACLIHKEAAKEDALVWGSFRSGSVTIAGTQYLPPKAEDLKRLWQEMIKESEKINDIYKKAIFIFLQISRNQFFYDVNKRMGRFMMNGLLLTNGYPVINVPALKQNEFNQKMIKFYDSNNPNEMTSFMIECLDPKMILIMSE